MKPLLLLVLLLSLGALTIFEGAAAFPSHRTGAVAGRPEDPTDLAIHELHRPAKFDASSRRNFKATASLLSCSFDDSYNNASFADYLCNFLATTPNTYSGVQISGYTFYYLLPDCFYDYFNTITSWSLGNVIIQGNATYHDPWIRLGAASPNTNTISLQNSKMADSEGAPSPMAWGYFFAALPSLITLQIADMSVGQVNLPSSFPTTLTTISVVRSDLSGLLPDGLLSSYSLTSITSFELNLQENALSGTIPSTLFAGLPRATLNSLHIDLSSNLLEGTIDRANFGGQWSSLQTIVLVMMNTALSGPLTNVLDTAVFISGTLTQVSLQFDNNRFSGSVPTTWFPNQSASACTVFVLSASKNSLGGIMPSSLIASYGFQNSMLLLSIRLGSNGLSGNILELTGIPHSQSVSIDVSSNPLGGAIPSNLFEPMSWADTADFTYSASNCSLAGSLPPTVLNARPAPILRTLIVMFDQNPGLAGALPNTIWTTLIPTSPATSTTSTFFSLLLGQTGVTGSLDLPDLSARLQPLQMSIDINNAGLQSLYIAPGAEKSIFSLILFGNSALEGTLPAPLFSPSSALIILYAANTSLNGSMPDMGSLRPPSAGLDLSYTDIDFCSGNRTIWSATISLCNLNVTSAHECAEYYPHCDTAFPTPTAVPTAEPLPPLTPPFEVPSAPPSGCRLETRPSVEFTCVGGIWTFFGTVNTTVLTIPAGATQTVIEGNVTSTSVVINGLGSTIIVHGCATNLSLITVTLTPEELKQIGNNPVTQALISVNASECGNLNTVAVTTHVKGKSCRKVASKSFEKDGTLSGVFTVNSSGCNTWWIVLVSVVCAVILLSIIIAVAITCWKSKLYKRDSKRLGNNAPKAAWK